MHDDRAIRWGRGGRKEGEGEEKIIDRGREKERIKISDDNFLRIRWEGKKRKEKEEEEEEIIEGGGREGDE